MFGIFMSASWNLEKSNSNKIINCLICKYGLLLQNNDIGKKPIVFYFNEKK